MARGVNKVILVGNVGQDPETRFLPSGGSVTNISLATSETWKDKETGQPQERTEWHRIVFFNRLAEIVGDYVKKGSKLYVEGSLRTRSWEKDGQKHYATDIVGAEMQMLDTRQGGGQQDQYAGHDQGGQRQQGSGQGQRSQGNSYAQQLGGTARRGPAQQNRQQAPAQDPAGFDSFDDDIPFN